MDVHLEFIGVQLGQLQPTYLGTIHPVHHDDHIRWVGAFDCRSLGFVRAHRRDGVRVEPDNLVNLDALRVRTQEVNCCRTVLLACTSKVTMLCIVLLVEGGLSAHVSPEHSRVLFSTTQKTLLRSSWAVVCCLLIVLVVPSQSIVCNFVGLAPHHGQQPFSSCSLSILTRPDTNVGSPPRGVSV